MLIDRTHRSWAMISTVILALGIVSYLMYAGASDKGATGGRSEAERESSTTSAAISPESAL